MYFGGGTPSLLHIEELEEVLRHVRAHFSFSPDTEITLEANPGDLTKEQLKGFMELGINRISLGVQSFDAKALAFLGRRHTVDDAEGAISLLKDAGFLNFGIDLIYGFREQPLLNWEETLHRALSFDPAHVSCYQLTIEPRTYFWKLVKAGRLTPLDEETARSQFLTTSRFLTSRGYRHYEISSFAKSEAYRSRHNLKYWTHVPYLGLGPSAHSFLGRQRWWNVRSLRKYNRRLMAMVSPVEDSEVLSEAQIALETTALGLRTHLGISSEAIGSDPDARGRLSRLEGEGLLKIRSGKIRPTPKGFAVADALPLYLSP